MHTHSFSTLYALHVQCVYMHSLNFKKTILFFKFRVTLHVQFSLLCMYSSPSYDDMYQQCNNRVKQFQAKKHQQSTIKKIKSIPKADQVQ